MNKLPPMRSKHMLYYVLCDPGGCVIAMGKTRVDCEIWFQGRHSIVVLTDEEKQRCRKLMAELGWTIRQVTLDFKPTGTVYPTQVKRTRVKEDFDFHFLSSKPARSKKVKKR